jgi:hypothetical protein
MALDRVVVGVSRAAVQLDRLVGAPTAASEAYNLAIDVSVVFGFPVSLSQPARHTSSRAASVRTRISAIIACTSWNDAMGRPNCSRCVAYLTDSSRQPWQTPTQPAATE